MISCVISLAIGFFISLFVLTVYVKYRNTDKAINTIKCKSCGSTQTVLRGFTAFMIEHYCPSCNQTFFTTK